jgi:hypothetical protein
MEAETGKAVRPGWAIKCGAGILVGIPGIYARATMTYTLYGLLLTLKQMAL